MCRLALMNRQAVHFLGFYLDYVFGHLENTLGGDGNGVAGLWVDRGTKKIRKGVKFTATQAAACAQKYAEQGADWILFHTRRATASTIADQHCHPYQAGRLVMAHNGHDMHFARLSKSLGITDSECMARAWSQMHFPLSALSTCSGVFMGFADDHPFVVKGQTYSDLLAAWNWEAGAILFASELPSWLVDGVFDQVVSLDTIQWFGRDLDPGTLNARPYVPPPVEASSFYRHWSYYGWTSEDEGLDDVLPPDEAAALEAAMYEEGMYEEEALEEEDWRLHRQVEDGYRRS